MSVPVPFGQYVSVESPVHALDARAKIAWAAGISVAAFSTDSLTGLALLGGLIALVVWLSRVPPRLALRGMRAVGLLLGFTLAVHGLEWGGDTAGAVRLVGDLHVSPSGLLEGLFFSARIVVLVVGTSVVTLTSTPMAITEALERIMAPLRSLRVPVTDVAMMLTIALRFIPTTATEAENIVVAQAARGARFDEGGPVARARAYVPVLIPLFVNLFRRADDLAVAMESRCYRGGEHRTRMNVSVMRGTDRIVVALVLLGTAAFAWWM